MEPICFDASSRLAAYKLLVELSRNSSRNYEQIVMQLISLHHNSSRAMSVNNEWNVIPLVAPRAECGYVGIKNGGATCYMNAVLQQLFMIPGVTDYLLSIEAEEDASVIEKTSMFWQLQNLFAHLKESKAEYYVPEQFWKAFRMWGQEVNLREQQDAFDFFISMTDQIDEHLKKMNKESMFKNVFEGTFSNQFICKDCPHK
jgi:ubiquitin carboxyl-terminal hydrolase 9/24